MKRETQIRKEEGIQKCYESRQIERTEKSLGKNQMKYLGITGKRE